MVVRETSKSSASSAWVWLPAVARGVCPRSGCHLICAEVAPRWKDDRHAESVPC